MHRDIPREIIAWIQEQLYRMKGLQIYYIEEEAMDAFWRTLIGNVTHETEEATKSVEPLSMPSSTSRNLQKV